MVEHSTADREVPGSNPGAPCYLFYIVCVNNSFFDCKANLVQIGVPCYLFLSFFNAILDNRKCLTCSFCKSPGGL